MTVFYDFSGGMESAAMLVLDRERIRQVDAIARFVDTRKHFPEMYESIKQVESILGISIIIPPNRISLEEFLFERGGMIRKGTNDCSRRMKRGNLSRHMRTYPKPYEVNLGFNVKEDARAQAFTERNDRDYLHWRYPLIEAGVTREQTWEICRKAGFSIIVGMYEKMGRFDCFWCGNQKPSQALKVIEHYPSLAKEWADAEAKKQHSFMPIPLTVLADDNGLCAAVAETGCSCFGGNDDATGEDELDEMEAGREGV